METQEPGYGGGRKESGGWGWGGELGLGLRVEKRRPRKGWRRRGREKASGDWNGVGEELLWDVSRGVGSAFSAPARPAVSPLPTSQPPLQAPVGPDLIPWLGTGPGI